MATGPGGRVWVSVTGADKLVWFDATSPTPSAHEIPLGAGCGPVGIVAGGDGRIYFSQPSSGVLCGADQIGYVKEDGGELTTISMFGILESVGRAYDLAVYGGKLFIPDYGGDVVRRAALGTLAPEAVVQMPAGSGPQGIAADASGEIWVTLSAIGKLARFPAGQTSGPAAVLTPQRWLAQQPLRHRRRRRRDVRRLGGRRQADGRRSDSDLQLHLTPFRRRTVAGGGCAERRTLGY
jgi:hypothetical protein